MVEVKFYSVSYLPAAGLTYSVVAAQFKGKWIFVRHHNRVTWEMPGGHIEKNETPDEAAARELKEETGATGFRIECVSTYSVTINGETGYGRLYYAEVYGLGPVPDTSEIKEIKIGCFKSEENTYPLIQSVLFEKILNHINKDQEGRKSFGFC